MVLSFNQASAKLKENVGSIDLLVLDVHEIPLHVNRQFFGWSIEVLKHIRYCVLANVLHSKQGKEPYVDCKILHDAIDVIFSNGKFDDVQLRAYYEVKRKIHHFFKSHEDIARIGSYINFEVDYFLLGAELDWESEDVPEGLDCKYETLLMDLVYGGKDLDEFITEAKKSVINFVKAERFRKSS